MKTTFDRSRILSRAEVQRVLSYLRRRAPRSRGTFRNLIIFRLATCCGLRRSEITGLELRDLELDRDRPVIRVRSEIAKGGRRRVVPLWWDAGTLHDLTSWVSCSGRTNNRTSAVHVAASPYVVSTRAGTRIDGAAVRRAFQSACRVLGRHVTIHDGRHTFASHAVAGGRSLVEVRDALGHSNLGTTSIYAHGLDDDSGVGNLFGTASGVSTRDTGDSRNALPWLTFSVIA
jgi:integrase/recombinase XerC